MNTSALRLALLLALVVTATASALALRTPRLWHPLESAAPEWRGPAMRLLSSGHGLTNRATIRPVKVTPVAALCARGPLTGPLTATVETSRTAPLVC